ncbi:hypothetical protein XAPC_3973 [Xanthomonas citri pv. punicae str. LMG 859]|nr:hypothetical protein XAPC_3973 [Xanthomonas citri pv. punicae str. LMG 859]
MLGCGASGRAARTGVRESIGSVRIGVGTMPLVGRCRPSDQLAACDEHRGGE